MTPRTKITSKGDKWGPRSELSTKYLARRVEKTSGNLASAGFSITEKFFTFAHRVFRVPSESRFLRIPLAIRISMYPMQIARAIILYRKRQRKILLLAPAKQRLIFWLHWRATSKSRSKRNLIKRDLYARRLFFNLNIGYLPHHK